MSKASGVLLSVLFIQYSRPTELFPSDGLKSSNSSLRRRLGGSSQTLAFGARPLVNMLLVLGFDVYRQDPQTTADVVKGQGYDLSKLRDDTWEGHPVYVVGADKGDLQSKQFWVTKDTLLFVREIEPAQGDPKKLEDIRFTDYRPLAGTWVAARVEIHSDDKLIFSEDYTDIQANVKLADGTFDPAQFSSTHWEK